MRRLLFAVVVVLGTCWTATAQDYPKAELFGGYSYYRADDGGNLHGWNASIAGNVNDWFGVVADFSGHYGQDFLSINAGGVIVDAESKNSAHNFLFGPRFTYRKHSTLEGFVHGLVGAQRFRIDASVDSPGVSIQVDETDTAFAWVVGGGLDAKIHKRVAWRVFQADYVHTRFSDDSQHNFRLSTGLVLRLGSN